MVLWITRHVGKQKGSDQMNRPATRRYARCIAHDLSRVAVTAYRVARYYLPFHIRGLVRSLFQHQ